MTQEIEAIYGDGVFRPLQAVLLAESQTVRIIVSTSSTADSGRDWDLLGALGDVVIAYDDQQICCHCMLTTIP